MTPLEIVNASRVPDTRSIFVLGCFEQRVTVYSQQVRALNLVDGILSENLVRPNGKIAIVGGGVAGMTAAVALSKAAPDLKQLDLFESRTRVLELQHGSGRFLHPHFYDWPAVGSNVADAGLPFMNWQAGPAGVVAEALRNEFELATRTSILRSHLGQAVTELQASSIGLVRVVTADGKATNRIYDAVILAIGFGIERCTDGDTQSYWTPSGLAGPIITPVDNPIIFISGNGDGGLVDFQMAAFNAMEHPQICQLIASLDLGPARNEFETIEAEAWANDADVDLYHEYQTRVLALVPHQAWAEIVEYLRPNVRIWLHTNEPRLFRRTTALHNRVATFLAIEAYKETAPQAVTLKIGVSFTGPPPSVGEVVLEGEAAFLPFRRFLRIGPDTESNLAPFSKLLENFPRRPANPARPESPTLTETARARFEPLRQLTEPIQAEIPPVAPIVNAPRNLTVSISLSANGRVVWAGDVSPNNIEEMWASGSSVSIYCDIKASNAFRLMPAIARFGAHANNFALYAYDRAAWDSGITALCANRTLPGPDLNFSCSVRDWEPPPLGLRLQVEQSMEEVIASVHEKLDSDLLRRLNEAIFEILGPAEIASGWPIEAALRQTLWEIWTQWVGVLNGNPEVSRRFLRLLASTDDQIGMADASLVRLGPKVMRPHLTKPTLFGLAFAACSGRAMQPAGRHPGNMVIEEVTGHTCGVGWINQRELRGRAASMQAWTTNIVLLSQLQDAVQLLEGDQRLDQSLADSVRVGLVSLADQPIVIGADEDFLIALQSGMAATELFFRTIFERRALASQQSLEEA